MVTGRASDVLACYESFTEKTLFLVDEALAEKTLLGKVAAARTGMGDGSLYLFGPHFEHPHFPMANLLVLLFHLVTSSHFLARPLIYHCHK
jgi:hypothetical protein